MAEKGGIRTDISNVNVPYFPTDNILKEIQQLELGNIKLEAYPGIGDEEDCQLECLEWHMGCDPNLVKADVATFNSLLSANSHRFTKQPVGPLYEHIAVKVKSCQMEG